MGRLQGLQTSLIALPTFLWWEGGSGYETKAGSGYETKAASGYETKAGHR